MKYRKKPVVIEAFQWTGAPDQTEDPEWIIAAIRNGTVSFVKEPFGMLIDTLEGTHRANPGDYIIQGIQGELYPCKPDIFKATYEPVMEVRERIAKEVYEGYTGLPWPGENKHLIKSAYQHADAILALPELELYYLDKFKGLFFEAQAKKCSECQKNLRSSE